MTTETFPFEKEIVDKNISSVYLFCQECLLLSINLPLEKECGNCGCKNTIAYYDAETIHNYIEENKSLCQKSKK